MGIDHQAGPSMFDAAYIGDDLFMEGRARTGGVRGGRRVFGPVHDDELIACCGSAKRIAAAAGERSAAAGSACGHVVFGATGIGCQARS
jgi:hypothetical protein